MTQKDDQLGLKELVAMGVGGMVGGGIFSVSIYTVWKQLDMPRILSFLSKC